MGKSIKRILFMLIVGVLTFYMSDNVYAIVDLPCGGYDIIGATSGQSMGGLTLNVEFADNKITPVPDNDYLITWKFNIDENITAKFFEEYYNTNSECPALSVTASCVDTTCTATVSKKNIRYDTTTATEANATKICTDNSNFDKEFEVIKTDLKVKYDNYIKKLSDSKDYEYYKRLLDGIDNNNFAHTLQSMSVPSKADMRKIEGKIGCHVSQDYFNTKLKEIDDLYSQKLDEAYAALRKGFEESKKNNTLTDDQAKIVEENINTAIDTAQEKLEAFSVSLREWHQSVNWGKIEDNSCNSILGPEMIDFLQMILNWVRIIAPTLVIVLSSIDFAGAMLKDDKDALSKATSRLVKRLIIAAALFFVPTIINFLLDIYSDVRGIDVNNIKCM